MQHWVSETVVSIIIELNALFEVNTSFNIASNYEISFPKIEVKHLEWGFWFYEWPINYVTEIGGGGVEHLRDRVWHGMRELCDFC